MFWNVYYVKGAFLDSDKAYEVLNGLKTYEMRVINKAVNTITLARILDAHPYITVNCPVLDHSPNHALLDAHMRLGLPAGLFTIDFERRPTKNGVDAATFKRFFDSLEPAIGLQVSLGQTNTLALCPGLTSHSELSEKAQADAGIAPTTIRISVGLEDPRRLIAHMQESARRTIEPAYPGFCDGFLPAAEIDRLYASVYKDVHARYIDSLPGFRTLAG
jgi:cystathionine beta-lyase/cystathionine gamma-synthase